jgi:hypothetical protein
MFEKESEGNETIPKTVGYHPGLNQPPWLRLKFTVTIMRMPMGFPLSRVGSYFHCATAWISALYVNLVRPYLQGLTLSRSTVGT